MSDRARMVSMVLVIDDATGRVAAMAADGPASIERVGAAQHEMKNVGVAIGPGPGQSVHSVELPQDVLSMSAEEKGKFLRYHRVAYDSGRAELVRLPD
jgi:hypothetical protein